MLLLDLGHGVGAGKDGVEHFVFAQANIGEEFVLHEQDCLHAHEFQHGQQRDDHGVARFAHLKEIDERDRVFDREQPLAQPVHHLRDRDGFVPQLEFRHVLATFEHLRKDFDQIHERNDQLAFDFFSGVIYQALGIPTDLFTPLFAVARIAGWLAHWLEQLENNRIFRPEQVYTGKMEAPYVPLKERT